MARDPAALMVGQYFKRKRELVEIILVSGSGLGISIMSLFIKESIELVSFYVILGIDLLINLVIGIKLHPNTIVFILFQI